MRITNNSIYATCQTGISFTVAVGKTFFLCQNWILMISALLSGTFGAALSYWVGSRYFGFGPWETALSVLVSNFVGFFALLLTLALERRLKSRRYLMGSALKTWGVLFVLYASGLAALDPALRDPLTLAAMVGPLIWSTGFMLPIWGPAQDNLLRWEFRRASRKAEGSRKDQFAAPKTNVIRVES